MKKQISYDLFEVDERVKARKKKRDRKDWIKDHIMEIVSALIAVAGIAVMVLKD